MPRFRAFYIPLVVVLGWLIAVPAAVGLDGQALFQEKCAACHGTSKEAPPIGPVKYAAVQWERFFTRQKHKRKKDISNLVNKEELSAIKQYLKDHAADSDRPVAAGMR